MKKFEKPRIVSSKCIEFEATRWNGDMIKSDFVAKLKEYVDFYPVCPEVEIGLGIPRDPIRVIDDKGELVLYQPSTEKDLTEKMVNFTDGFLDNKSEVDGFILKNKSPSCGIKAVRVYQGYGKGRPRNGYGFFGGEVLKRFPYLAVEDEGRLRNLKIREHFLTKLYTLASFRSVNESQNLKYLIDFHTNNKLLLSSYSSENTKKMGRIIAEQDMMDRTELFSKYEDIFRDTIKKDVERKFNINVLMHSMGYFKKELSSHEKSFFLDSIEKYRNGIYPLLVLQNILKSWSIRFENNYLGNQTFLEPYPEELIEITTVYE
ncbi:YbgA family protein [Methanobacterium sp. ACI-7]|uniref:YbgA family protein n=1 Tax=unclassified Methanobacterium TaxID=2627676 RepID=UPI0039C260D1